MCSTYTASSYADLDPGAMSFNFVDNQDKQQSRIGLTSTFRSSKQSKINFLLFNYIHTNKFISFKAKRMQIQK